MNVIVIDLVKICIVFLSFMNYVFDQRINRILSHTGMAGKDDLADAVLGGASDFMADIIAKMAQWFEMEDDQQVFCMHVSRCLNVLTTIF